VLPELGCYGWKVDQHKIFRVLPKVLYLWKRLRTILIGYGFIIGQYFVRIGKTCLPKIMLDFEEKYFKISKIDIGNQNVFFYRYFLY